MVAEPAGLTLLIAVAVGVADQGGDDVAPVGVLHVGALVDARTPASLLQELEVDDGGLGFRGWQDVRLGEPDRGDWARCLMLRRASC